MPAPVPEGFDAITKLTKDLKKASVTLSRDEARFLVDSYYTMQEQRIRSDAQVRAMTTSGEPHSVLQWFASQSSQLEHQVQRALDAYSASFKLGWWAREIYGIGPVISAGLLAHIDIEKSQTCGSLWRFAGLDPTSKWARGEKRPWNASLKVLCWKIGESFLKQSGREQDIYGHIIIARRDLEAAQNEAGQYREQALQVAADRPTHAQVKIYKEGKLPPGHILARAKRYGVKLFLSHFHYVAFRLRYDVEPPKPFILTQPEHTHMIMPPAWPLGCPDNLQPLP